MEDRLIEKAQAALTYCRDHRLTLVLAESCTGGLVAASLTQIAGASDVLERGLVTYSNRAKTELLGVPEELISAQGAVSGAVACAMAQGALDASPADMAIAITGIAGPTGGTEAKPVGTVHIAKAIRTPDGVNTTHLPCDFGAQERHIIQALSAMTALELITQEDESGLIA